MLAIYDGPPILNELRSANDGAGGTYSYIFFNSDKHS